MDALELLGTVDLVPVVTIDSAERAVPLANALFAAGFRAIEVTLRTPVAVESIAAIANEVPDIICGAGSIRNPDQLDAVRVAGARFGVCPGSSANLLAAARDFPFVPGAETSTEVISLLDEGYRLQKFFPAEVIGGLARISALAAPLPDVLFFPTGGIDASLAKKYLQHANVHCIGGSWFVSRDLVAGGDFATVEQSARNAINGLK
jgi:2-dehydro-3-deoxyphosphogluconate aldolase/(4S)-4-hydroxy-2-oxoglutarate aldolase